MTRTKSKKSGVRKPHQGSGRAVSLQQNNNKQRNNDPRWYFGAQDIGIGSGDPPKGGGRRRGITHARPQHYSQESFRHASKLQEICEDEVIGLVSGNTSFECSTLALQIGNAETFPWGSRIAALFERYKFIELEVYLKPVVSGYATAGQQGKVILSCDYDSASSALQNYRQAETMDPHADGMPFETVRLRLDPERLTPGRQGKYIRPGVLPPGTDIKTYDAGALYFCASGTADTSDIAELRVRYRVVFMNPRLPNETNAISNFKTTRFTLGVTANATGTIDPVPYDTTAFNGLSLNNTGGIVTLPSGIFRVDVGVFGDHSANAYGDFDIKLFHNATEYDVTKYRNTTGFSHYGNIGSIVIIAAEGDTLKVSAFISFGAGTSTYSSSIAITVL